MAKKKVKSSSTIAQNRTARHDYQISDRFECGMELQGWEVKSIRAGKANITESYVFAKGNELFVSGTQIIPITTTCSHIQANPTRIRKLLLSRKEIDKLIGLVNRDGFTLVATEMYWSKSWVKLKVGLAKGKKLHDKRHDDKERDWNREKSRQLKQSSR